MSVFRLEIFTPQRLFFEGEAVSLAVQAPDGEICIMAHHAPLVTSLVSGALRIRTEGGVREAFHSEGFLEVRHDNTVQVFAQACEYPDEIDEGRAHAAEEAAREMLRHSEIRPAKYAALSLRRAEERLRIKERQEKEKK